MMPLKVAVIGNCQTVQIAYILNICCPGIEVVKVPPVHTIDPQNINIVLESISSSDLVLTQPISDGYSVEAVRTSNVKSINPNTLTFTNIFSLVYYADLRIIIHPSFCGPGNRLPGPLQGVHYQQLIDSYLEGSPFHVALSRFAAPSSRYQSIFKSKIDYSRRELIRRDAAIDLKFAPIFHQLEASSQALHQCNHPSLWLMHELVRFICLSISQSFNGLCVDSICSHLNNRVHIPCSPHCGIGAQLSFLPSRIWKGYSLSPREPGNITNEIRFFDMERLVNIYYELYAHVGLHELEGLRIDPLG